MPSTTSITYLIQQLKEGKRDAVQKLWESLFFSAGVRCPAGCSVPQTTG